MSEPWLIYVLTLMAGVGGFLFGYDTGVVSGAMSIIVEDSTVNNKSVEDGGLLSGLSTTEQDLWHQLIVASTVGAAAVVSLVAGLPTERLGRKPTILMASVVFLVGSVVMGAAPNKQILLVGRVVVGGGIGLASMSIPVYISEAAPPHLRGRLVVSYNTMVVGGQFVATVVCGLFAQVDQGWRYMLGLAAVPAALQFIGFIFMPESPRWLMTKGKKEEAEKVLGKIRRNNIVEQELQEIEDSIVNEKSNGSSDNFLRIFRNSATKRALIIGCSLQLFQQVSGINTLMYYTATIVSMAGIGTASSAIWITVGITAFYLASCFIGMYLVERLGRRKLLLGSLLGVILSLILIAIGFQLSDNNSPSAAQRPGECGEYTSCSDCVQADGCGFCGGSEADSLGGFCISSNGGNCSLTWYPDFCPTETAYSWTIIIGLAAYLVSFAAGMAPLPWTINSEIYPLWARSTATSLSTGVNWTFNVIISISFLSLTRLLTRYGAFYLYCGLATMAFTLFLLVLPETRGVPLERMEGLFTGSWIVLRKR